MLPRCAASLPSVSRNPGETRKTQPVIPDLGLSRPLHLSRRPSTLVGMRATPAPQPVPSVGRVDPSSGQRRDAGHVVRFQPNGRSGALTTHVRPRRARRPPRPGAGAMDLAVLTLSGLSAPLSFTYQGTPPPVPAPLVTSLALNGTAPASGGTNLWVLGSNLAGARSTSAILRAAEHDLWAESLQRVVITAVPVWAPTWRPTPDSRHLVLPGTVNVRPWVDLLSQSGRYLDSAGSPRVTVTANTWTKRTVTFTPTSGRCSECGRTHRHRRACRTGAQRARCKRNPTEGTGLA